ncbi:aromatic acid exporter family protein [Glaciihabitans sp. dw_435]|uniref:FUSC family protein n=1 Tax=Glaciihabitans sp. dw_435 TaxID=2720081 RepID=UPI001BD5815E|nr:FUSC family protein [Glaciihabitans sp. dw_435]
MKIPATLRLQTRSSLPQVLKTSVAAIASWLLAAVLLGQPLPIFAAIAALLVVQPSLTQSLARGIERSIGVILGVLLAETIGYFFGSASWIVLSVIVISLLLAWLLRLGPASANQIPISAMLVLVVGSQTPAYAFDRILETILGAAVALAVNILIVPPVTVAPAHAAVARLLRESAASLDLLATTLRTPQDAASLTALMTQVRTLPGLRDVATAAVASGSDSLTMNPRKGRNRQVLERDTELLRRLSVLVNRIVGMARALHDRYDDDLHVEPTVADIARELTRAAHDLRLLGHGGEGTDDASVQQIVEPPALTAPLSIARPHPRHWVLIGSLVEDMRRVREEIVGAIDG